MNPIDRVHPMLLSGRTGTWEGTNGFRLMPSDPLAERPAAATVTSAAGGHLFAIAYRWKHPDDGPQDGLLVVGAADEDGALVAMWGDSWHQKPAPMSLTGSQRAATAITLEAIYADEWTWRIVIESPDSGDLQIRMENVVPAAHANAEIPAGPYPAMIMQVRRT